MSEPIIPDPLDDIIAREELRRMVEEAHERIQTLIRITFHRQELFDAWYAKHIMSATIRAIAQAQGISWNAAKKRIKTANEIVFSFRNSLHKIDD